MRVLLLNYEFPPIGGGAGKASLCLLKEYAGRNDLEIDVLTSKPEPGGSVENFSENITIHKVGVHKKNLHFWRKSEVLEWLFKAERYYRRMIEDKDYDLAHAFFGFPTGWLCYIHRKKLAYIISLRGSDVPGYNVRLGLDYKILGPTFKRIWNEASAVIANSNGLRSLAMKFTPKLEIGIIHNGIYTDHFSPVAEKKMSKPLKLLTVCRLIRRKRIDLLIDTVARAKESNIEMELNIAGDGKLGNALALHAKKANVDDNVNLMGRIDAEEMPQVYRDNDVFVMSSAHEGMSNAMLEAMASGLPVITTRCEGVEELIADNGIVVDGDSATDIAEAIIDLAGDQDRFEKMCIAARRRAEQFEWSDVAGRYIDCYRTVINEGGEDE